MSKPFTMAHTGLKMLDDLRHHMPPSLEANFAQNPYSPVPSFVDTGETPSTQGNVDAFRQLAAPAPAKKQPEVQSVGSGGLRCVANHRRMGGTSKP